MNDSNGYAGKIVALLQEKIRLEASHRRIFYLTFGILWLSGSLWVIAEWLKETDLGPVRTPLQTQSMKIHGAVMLLYTAILGTLWTHIRRGFALRANRLSGTWMIGGNAALIVSGWILYYIGDDRLRQWASLTHWTIGLAMLPLLLGHLQLGRHGTGPLSH